MASQGILKQGFLVKKVNFMDPLSIPVHCPLQRYFSKVGALTRVRSTSAQAETYLEFCGSIIGTANSSLEAMALYVYT